MYLTIDGDPWRVSALPSFHLPGEPDSDPTPAGLRFTHQGSGEIRTIHSPLVDDYGGPEQMPDVLLVMLFRSASPAGSVTSS